MEVRAATSADALAIATVHVRSWQAAYRGLLPQSYLDALDPGQNVGRWRTILEATRWPSTGVFVLVDGDAGPAAPAGAGDPDGSGVTGFAGMSATRDDDEDPRAVGELQTLYLHPDRWRKGGGSMLLGAVEGQLSHAGFQTATAWVLETNARARTFYERRRWHFDGTSKPHDWGTFTVTDVRYRLSLT